jgi:hypothetical protein
LENIWKEGFMTISKNFPVIILGLKTTTETSVSTTGVPAVIRTEHLPDVSAKRYVYANALGSKYN